MTYKEKLALLKTISVITQNIVNIENYIHDLQYKYRELTNVTASYAIYGESYSYNRNESRYDNENLPIPNDLALKQANELLSYWKEKEQTELNKLIDKEDNKLEF